MILDQAGQSATSARDGLHRKATSGQDGQLWTLDQGGKQHRPEIEPVGQRCRSIGMMYKFKVIQDSNS